MELVEGTPVGPVANVRDLLDVATDPGAGDCLTRWQVGDRGRAGHHGVQAEYVILSGKWHVQIPL